VSISCNAPGAVSTSSAGAPLCLNPSDSSVVAWTSQPDFDFSTFDTASASAAFAAGFVIVGTLWAIGKAVGLLLGVVRR